jgi:hypothetical protein
MEVHFLNQAFAVIAPIAASIPILIHLLAIRRRRRIPFTMVRLLERAVVQAHGVRRLREWLIVIVRSVAVFLMLVALARPLVYGVRFKAIGYDAAICMLIDDTLSMAFLEKGRSRFERAIKCATTLKGIFPRCRYCILSISNPSEPVLHWTTRESELDGALSKLTVSHSSGSVRQALIKAGEMLRQVDSAVRVLLVLTDGQDVESLITSDVPAVDGKSVRLVKVIVDVRESDEDVNVAALDWDVAVRTFSLPQRAILKLRLRNFGSKQWKGALSVTVDGEPIAKPVPVTIKGTEESLVAIQLPILRSGWHVGFVSWDDALPMDNKLHFAFYNPMPVSILCVDAKQRSLSGSSYILDAVESIRTAIGLGSIRVGMRTAIPQTFAELMQWHVIIWSRPSELTSGAESALKKWVSSGGTLIMFASEHRGNLPSWLSPAGKAIGEASGRRVQLTPFGREVFQNISSEQFSDVLVFRRFRAEKEAMGVALLCFDDGAPALTEREVGKGRIFNFWFTPDASSSTFFTSPSFVPLLCELLQYALAQSHSVVKSTGVGGVRIERGMGGLSSSAIVCNTDASDSNTRIPSFNNLKWMARKAGWNYMTVNELEQGLKIDVPSDMSTLLLAFCVGLLIVEIALRTSSTKPR